MKSSLSQIAFVVFCLFANGSRAEAIAPDASASCGDYEVWEICVHVYCESEEKILGFYTGNWRVTADQTICSQPPHWTIVEGGDSSEGQERMDDIFQQVKADGEAGNNDHHRCEVTLVSWDFVGWNAYCAYDGEDFPYDETFTKRVTDLTKIRAVGVEVGEKNKNILRE